MRLQKDYSTLANDALKAVQIKDTSASGTLTLTTASVRDAINSFVDLVARNPRYSVELRYLTTSPIGVERDRVGLPDGGTGLAYWRRAAAGADVQPLRLMLDNEKSTNVVRQFVKGRADAELRRELLQKIHWDCGQGDLGAVRQDFEDRLVVLGREHFRLPASESRRLADVLAHFVLRTSVLKDPGERVLTRADLYSAIDGATRVSISRATLETIAPLTFSVGFLAADAEGMSFTTSNISWIATSGDLPIPRFIIPRPETETKIAEILKTFGLAILVGGTGVGKSLLARSVAVRQESTFVTADLRDTVASEAINRLHALNARLGSMPSGCTILDDLDEAEDESVSSSLARLIVALHRQDRSCILTLHRSPSPRTLSRLGVDPTATFEVPYFSEREVSELVQLTGGEPKIWGRVAYIAGGGGHPQLIHALVTGMAARGWPKNALDEVITRGFSSGDIDVARVAARRTLTGALPADTRNLLYRLSLPIGRFDRSLALSIASLAPAIPNAGDRLDELIGPWIETAERGRLRVSPLISNAGRESLPIAEQREIDRLIANELLVRRTVNASDASTILTHALAGKSANSLSLLARMVITTSQEGLGHLSEQFFMLRALRTDRPIYADDLFVSVLLRLAQFKLVAETGERERIVACANALQVEAASVADAQARWHLEILVLSVILMTRGIGDHLQNWVELLRRFRKIAETSAEARELVALFEGAGGGAGHSLYGVLFAIGAIGISSVARLQCVFRRNPATDSGATLPPIPV